MKSFTFRYYNSFNKKIYFTIPKKDIRKPNNEPKKWNQNLFLLDSSYKFDIFQFIPRKFIITTKNGSSNFNKEMMMSFSQTISYKCYNPENNQFDLDIADEENVLDKFSQIFQGKTVSFTDEDLLISYKIVRLLDIKNCPNFMKPYDLQTKEDRETVAYQNNQETENEAVLDFTNFDEFLRDHFEQTFSIVTKKRTYKCNIYAVYSSNVIGEFLKQNPEASSFKFDIEDEYEEFENINKIFNFERVNITSDNARSLDKMIKELEITSLYENIDNFRNTYDQTNAKINKEEEKIDEINEIISLLHNINENNFQETEKEIIKYTQNKDESEIQEFCSFLIQFVKTEDNKIKQELLSELLIDLDKKSATNETLKILMPQFIKQLLFIIGITRSTCSFAYILYKKGKISINNIANSISNAAYDHYPKAKRYIQPYIIDQKKEMNTINKKMSFYPIPEKPKDEDDITPIISTNFCFWFLPEIIRMKVLNYLTIRKVVDGNGSSYYTNFYSILNQSPLEPASIKILEKFEKDRNFTYLDTFLPDKLDVYKQMRDNGEPLDELTIALRRDDVDKLQQILSINKIDKKSKMLVPYNIFEEYIENGETSCINYSAAYGSIKCFKYLLSKHHKIDSQTFKYAVYGGNIEIVKSVGFCAHQKNELISSIVLSIAKHRNDIFDWIMSDVFFQKVTDQNAPIFKTIIKYAAKNSNAHSLIRIYGRGYDMSEDFNDLIALASANGFYKIIQLICLLTKKKYPTLYYFKVERVKNNYEYVIPSFFNENLSIFKLYTKNNLGKELYQYIIKYAILRKYKTIIKYFFENLSNRAACFQSDFLIECMLNALEIKNDNDIFYSIFNNIQKIYKNFFDDQKLTNRILVRSINTKKIEITKEIIQSILPKNPKKDFSSAFAYAVENNLIDLCHYILDNKLFIDNCNLANRFHVIRNVNEETFSLFINSIPSSLKNLFIMSNLNGAIASKNIHLIKYLFDQNAKSELALIEAVKTNDIKIFELVLDNFDMEFINENTKKGTALTIAVEKSNLEIVNKLLSIEGIDPSLVDSNNQTALNIAIIKQEIEICNKILDFYGENIKDQVSQINESIKIILKSRYSTGFRVKQDKFSQMTKIVPILKRILEVENVDLNCVEDNYSILSFACKINEASLVEYLLKNDKVKVNLKDPKEGNTALIVSILNENYDIAKMLIEHSGTNLNISNYKKETALTISVSQENEDIIKKIINNSKFEATKSRLDYAFYISSPKISKLLISSKTLDVNYLYRKTNNSHSFTSRSYSSNYFHSSEISKLCTTKLVDIASSDNKDEYEIVDLIIQHPTFDKEKSLCKLALFKSTENKGRIYVFKKLFALFNDNVNIIDENGTTLLISAAMNNNDELVELILNDPKFDCNKSLIVYAYYKSFNSMLSIKFEKYMHEHSQSINFDYVFPDGSTIFTAIVSEISRTKKDESTYQRKKNVSNAVNAINFLCENGADPNKPNKQGKYPLEISMKSLAELMNTVSIALIDSNKIDLNIKLNTNNDGKYSNSNEYYIHIAVDLKDTSILERMLKDKSVDINIPNSDGNTPLMISCKNRNESKIKLFFTRDDLDFLHRNNEGQDALMLLKRNDDDKIEPIQDKNEYLNKLLECFVRPKPALNSNFNSSNKSSLSFSFKLPRGGMKFDIGKK